MGSMSSRPKTPKVATQTVYVPVVSTATPVTAPTTGDSASGTTTDGASSGATADSIRQTSLLERGRGRLGTILTGFRGVLSDGVSTDRKTLLGE